MIKPDYTGKYISDIFRPYDIFNIGYNGQHNFITSTYVDCYEIEHNINMIRRFVEISRGTGISGHDIYAVSVIDVDSGGQIILRHDLSRLTGGSITSTKDYINEIKLET